MITLCIGIFLFAVVTISAGLHFRRKRIKRRDEPYFDVPGFLRNPPEPSDDTRGSSKINGLDVPAIHLSRHRGPRKDGGPSV